ncbi:MAG: hypothetical protein ABEJ42_00850 [Halobacteriaceae archaeon]
MPRDADTVRVPVVCEACGTTTRVSLDDLAATLERHNDRLHDGAEEAVVDPELSDQIASLAAEDILDAE